VVYPVYNFAGNHDFIRDLEVIALPTEALAQVEAWRNNDPYSICLK